jgi:indolepyruvate ferredoxin oxidoreductase beta subunit
VAAADADIVRVYDFFKPGALEIAAILPRRLGQWLERGALGGSPRAHGGKGIKLQTSSVSGSLALHFAAGLKRLRPYSLRFGREQQAIDEWLEAVEQALVGPGKAGIPIALELARLPRLLKGYGDTHASGSEAFQRILGAYRERGAAGSADVAEALSAMMRASLENAGCRSPSDPQRMPASGTRTQKIVWVDRR